MTNRPYKHTIATVNATVVLGSYATLAAAVRAAKKAEAARPDETRQVRKGNATLRNRYAHGPVASWAG